MRRRVLFAVVLASVAGCGGGTTPTAPQTTLLMTILEPAQGGLPAGKDAVASAPTRHVSTHKVGGGVAEVEVRLDVVEAGGGRYLHRVEIVAIDAGGGALAASIPSGVMPVNRGTPDAPVASLRVMVEWRKDSTFSKQLRQTSLDLKADGTVSAM